MILHILIAALLTWLALLVILYAAIFALAKIGWLTRTSVPAMKKTWSYQTIVFVASVLITPFAALFVMLTRMGCSMALAVVSMRIRRLEAKVRAQEVEEG